MDLYYNNIFLINNNYIILNEYKIKTNNIMTETPHHFN